MGLKDRIFDQLGDGSSTEEDTSERDESDSSGEEWGEDDIETFLEKMNEELGNVDGHPESSPFAGLDESSQPDVSIEDMLPPEMLEEMENIYDQNEGEYVTLELNKNELNAVLASSMEEYHGPTIDPMYGDSIEGVLRKSLRKLAESENVTVERLCRDMGIDFDELFFAGEDDDGIEQPVDGE